jgi:hypothetical protein
MHNEELQSSWPQGTEQFPVFLLPVEGNYSDMYRVSVLSSSKPPRLCAVWGMSL